jgi:hypothetical protein
MERDMVGLLVMCRITMFGIAHPGDTPQAAGLEIGRPDPHPAKRGGLCLFQQVF